MAALIEPGLLPASGILFVGGEPKVGKSILVANLALALASGSSRAGFHVPAARRVLICQFELPAAQFARRLAPMRSPIGEAADSNLLIDIEAAGHLLSAPRGLDHFLRAIRTAKADVVVLDPVMKLAGLRQYVQQCNGALSPAVAWCFFGGRLDLAKPFDPVIASPAGDHEPKWSSMKSRNTRAIHSECDQRGGLHLTLER